MDLYKEKLADSTIRLLQGVPFEAKGSTEILDVLFRATTTPEDQQSLWLGSGAAKLLLDRQTEHLQSAKGFISALKVRPDDTCERRLC